MDLAAKIESLVRSLRQGQREMGEWQGGTLAVSAVPGAGKSFGMAVAAAIALAKMPRNRQIILVTFTRSAAISLKRKVKDNLKILGLPNQGYTVQTLHSLALSIANQHPQQSGIQLDQMTLISPYRGHQLIQETVDTWIQTHRPLYRQLVEQGSFDGEETNRLQRQSVLSSDILPAIAAIVIQEAKSSGLSPQDLDDAARQETPDLPLLKIGAGLYDTYEALLASRQLIDYEDMILGALRALKHPHIQAQWQEKIWAVFEDEAQDSTPLQFELLEILATQDSHPMNLIRVGDTNQAINSSFTPADPKHFRTFCNQQQQQGKLAHMLYAGRSTPLILETANQFLCWANQQGPVFSPQSIHPVPEGDPQPDSNPPALGTGVEVVFPTDIYRTGDAIATRIQQLYAQDSSLTFAILVREHKQGQFLADVLANPQSYDLAFNLSELGLTIYDVGQEQQMSNIPRQMLTLLHFIAKPHSPRYFKQALELLQEQNCIEKFDWTAIVAEPERFLYPSPIDPNQPTELKSARLFCTQLLRARTELPQFQLLSFLAIALGYEQADLATADKLASRIMQQTESNRTLESIIDALQTLLTSERFEPVSVDPDQQNLCRDRQITILTMHKAKGLDWDVVFIPFLHESMIPGRMGVSQSAKFLGDISLPDVSRHLIRGWAQDQHLPSLQAAWEKTKALKTAEEYRLLYVAMTRPKRLLWMSACDYAPFWWGGFPWDRPDLLQVQTPVKFLSQMTQAKTVLIHPADPQ